MPEDIINLKLDEEPNIIIGLCTILGTWGAHGTACWVRLAASSDEPLHKRLTSRRPVALGWAETFNKGYRRVKWRAA